MENWKQMIKASNEAYLKGLAIMAQAAAEDPAFTAMLGQPLEKQYRVELLSALLYLAETTGDLSDRQVSFIDGVLQFQYTKEQLSALSQRLDLHKAGFGSLIPTCLKAAVRLDERQEQSGTLASPTCAMRMLKILETITENFCRCTGKKEPLEDMEQRIYLLTLTHWISDQQPSDALPQKIMKEENQTVEGHKIPALPKEGEQEKTESLDDLLKELDDLVGLKQVKEDVSSQINLLKVRKLRRERNLTDLPVSMHLVFTGNPGTGKTTVARLLAKIYKALGVLSKGQLVEVDRSELVGGYVGQTAIKTQEVINSALGGVLFIDEAYSLTADRDPSDFGYEAVATLLVEMENHRDDLAVIVAGYPEPMEQFLQSNPGLKSRFNKFIHFDDYKPEELMKIFESMAGKQGFKMDTSTKEKAIGLFEKMYDEREEDFANGRSVRNFFEKAIVRQANRLAGQDQISDEDLLTLKLEDLEDKPATDSKDEEEKKEHSGSDKGSGEKTEHQQLVDQLSQEEERARKALSSMRQNVPALMKTPEQETVPAEKKDGE